MKYIFTTIIIFLFGYGFNQEVLNLRYDLNYNNIVFENIIVTDSCYYTTSYSIPENSNKVEGGFIKINFNGSIDIASHHVNDTMHIQFISTHSDLINTLDNNFAIIASATTLAGKRNLQFFKLTPNGDTLFTALIDSTNFADNIILNVNTLIQNHDSTFFCIIQLDSYVSELGSVSLIKLSKTGNLLWYKSFYGLSSSNYRILNANSLLKYDTNKLLIGGVLIHIPFGGSAPELNRMHTKLIMVDTLGNIIQQRTYLEDTLNYTVNGLTKTIDGGLLYCGKYGRFFPSNNDNRWKSQITKLDANFDLEWRMELGFYGAYNYGLNNLITLNDSEFVAVGNSFSIDGAAIPNGRTGWLVKFNINGEILWERKYTKVPHFDGENNWATHILYDVDVTKDSGFVMVGQSTNYYTDNGVPSGQQGWLVKVDKHGCLVPNCQQYDNVVDTTNTDTTVVVEPVETAELYPNPANTNLYYYHTQTDTSEAYQPSTAYIYDMSGKTVQKWLLNDNNITYIIDVANFKSGTYVLKVISDVGNVLRTKKFVVLH